MIREPFRGAKFLRALSNCGRTLTSCDWWNEADFGSMIESMANHAFEINGDTKVAALLEAYPELEETLIAMAPPFKKLRNPILRRSVAKVASLRQAAAVGRLPITGMVNELRSAVGLEPIDDETNEEVHEYFGAQPAWFDESKIVVSLSEESDFDESKMPITSIVKHCNELHEGEILEIRASFLPAPGIDLMLAKGFLSWSIEDEGGRVRTYLTKLKK